MEIYGLSDLTWISIIAFVLCLAFGLYMTITGKPGIVRSINDRSEYKDREQYAKKGGKLILFLAGGCFVMGVVSFFNTTVSNIIGLVVLGIFAYFWKKMSDEFGPV
jgi:uncharacterized membrane protein HdeD (DUF308 family)